MFAGANKLSRLDDPAIARFHDDQALYSGDLRPSHLDKGGDNPRDNTSYTLDKDLRPPTRSKAPLSLVLLLIVTASLAAGGLYVRSVSSAVFWDADQIRNSRAHVNDMLRHQLDEETGVRGYAATGLSVFLQPYYSGRKNLTVDFRRVRAELESLGVKEALPVLRDAETTNHRWVHEVALSLIRRPGRNAAIELRGKTLVDRFRADSSMIYGDLSRRTAVISSRAKRAVVLISTFAAGAVALVLLAALALMLQQRRDRKRFEQQGLRADRERQKFTESRAAYESEKYLSDTLQDALLQRDFPELPTLSFSATYIPATEESRVGGDWYDALLLPEGRVLLVIGDVAGHGVNAIVAMNRARQLLTRSALIDADPAAVVRRANLELIRLGSPIITAISAIIDPRTYEFTYAVAGHPPPVLFEPGRPARFLECGALPLGVATDAEYRTNSVRTVPGAMFVLYTDGAIEYSRDALAGEVALLDAVEGAARRPRGQAARAIRETIFNFEEIGDDVAILTIRLWDMPHEQPLKVETKPQALHGVRNVPQILESDARALRRIA